MAKSGVASRPRDSRPSGAGTRQALVQGAIETLKSDGFAGASARTIADRAGCNQALVFYHFGSVVDLLLAALDEVSSRRMDRYQVAIAGVETLADLVGAAVEIFSEDLDEGYVTVLAQMIAGSSTTPGLGGQVAARIAPWRDFARDAIESALSGSPLGSLVPIEEAAHAVVALYLGLEMLSQLDADRDRALALFDHVGRLTALLGALGPIRPAPTRRRTKR